jgi:hypothetical protein
MPARLFSGIEGSKATNALPDLRMANAATTAHKDFFKAEGHDVFRSGTQCTQVIGHKIFSGEASIWLVSIAAFAQALSTLDSPSAQFAHPLAQAAQVLFSHVLLPVLQANHES